MLLGEELEKKSNRKIEIGKLLAEGDFILDYILKLNLSIEANKGIIIETSLKEELEKKSNERMEIDELLAEKAFILSHIPE